MKTPIGLALVLAALQIGTSLHVPMNMDGCLIISTIGCVFYFVLLQLRIEAYIRSEAARDIEEHGHYLASIEILHLGMTLSYGLAIQLIALPFVHLVLMADFSSVKLFVVLLNNIYMIVILAILDCTRMQNYARAR